MNLISSSSSSLSPSRHKGLFKLRSNIEKKVVVTVQQISRNSCHLNVERCFGMLVSPGRNVRHADMQLLEHVTMATTTSNNSSGNADPNNAADSAITHIITGTYANCLKTRVQLNHMFLSRTF